MKGKSGRGGLRAMLAAAIVVVTSMISTAGIGEEDAAETPKYEAKSSLEFHLRKEPDSTYQVASVPRKGLLKVYEWGKEWCRASYKGTMGWCKTKWLWGFRSLDAMRYPVPNAQITCGVLTAEEDVFLQGGDFSGLTVKAGAMLCPTAQEGERFILPVWRGKTALPAAAFRYQPFAAWQDAQAGEAICGFTTFYNEKTGGTMAAERAYNIALGCERINNVTVGPGGSFSFNEICGPYWRQNGYQKAPNISNDGAGYGGGICQVTTTLYNALLGAPIQITDWAVHRYSGVQYIPQFFDAAVGTYSDLKFENTLPYAIQIQAMPQDGAVTVLIRRAE